MRHLGLIAIILLCTLEANAQQPEPKPYPRAAIERLRHLKGAWRMESDVIGPQGEVGQTTVAYDTLDWLVPERILGFTSHTPASESVSRGMWFYDTVAERFYLISVNGDTGELWTLWGDLEKWTITSEPKRRSNGSEVIIRFHHHDIKPDSFQATMELSVDGGRTWTVRYRQRLTRLR